MYRQTVFIISFFLAPLLCPAAAPVFAQANQTESLTITTYYPAPYGVYRNLKLNPSTVPTGGAVSRGVMYYDDAADTVKIYSNSGWVNLGGGGGGSWTENSTANTVYLTNSTRRVGIGVTPQSYARLDVNTTGSMSIHTMDTVNGGLLIGYQGSTIQARTTADGNTANLSLQNWGGNVGIGTSVPAQKLEVSGNILATAFYYSSDRSLKKNIRPLNDSLEKIDRLQGIAFQWKKDGRSDIGLAAQDVEKVYPELVSTDRNSGLKSVEYGNLAAVLIEAVKEQQKEIRQLKAEIKELKGKR